QLADQVAVQIRSLEGEKGVIELAIAEVNRLEARIRAMDGEMAALRDIGLQAAAAEQLVERVEQAARDANARLEAGERARDAFAADVKRLEEARETMTGVLQAQSERVAAGIREMDA